MRISLHQRPVFKKWAQTDKLRKRAAQPGDSNGCSGPTVCPSVLVEYVKLAPLDENRHTHPADEFIKLGTTCILKKNFACCQIKSALVFSDILDGPFRTGTVHQYLELSKIATYILKMIGMKFYGKQY